MKGLRICQLSINNNSIILSMLINQSLSDDIPGESFLYNCLQKNIGLSLNNRVIKRGKLLLYRRFHYFIQLAVFTEKGIRENVDVPIPFNVENHPDDNLCYFDYRLRSLNVDSLPKFPDKVSSIYFDNILEIYIMDNFSLKCVPFVSSRNGSN